MRKVLVLLLLGIGASGLALASAVPEIDPGSGLSALAMLSGALLVFRSRNRK